MSAVGLQESGTSLRRSATIRVICCCTVLASAVARPVPSTPTVPVHFIGRVRQIALRYYNDLRYVYEQNPKFCAFPTFPVSLAMKGHTFDVDTPASSDQYLGKVFAGCMHALNVAHREKSRIPGLSPPAANALAFQK